ncbi:MAG TPA: transglycosylase domain-containing protein [Longimicrobiales bacterium]|nr:transglycosylase domain-containing protein [Longimicrobiales bacterium]
MNRRGALPTTRVTLPVTAVTTVLLAVAGGLSRAFSVSCGDAWSCVSLNELVEGAPLPEAIHIYDAGGELLYEVGGPRRRAVPRERIPDLLADGYVAVEDRRFWEHSGVDARGVLRAALRNVREGGIEEGASTIPMQLVRTLWAESLRDVGPWRRKVIEARTAPLLVGELGRERVLTLYMNAIYLGDGVYGVDQAARHYFGVPVGSLDLAQAATLIGITRSPEYYEPRAHPERALAVRNTVLATLRDVGLIGPEEAERAMAEDLRLVELGPDAGDLYRRTHLSAAVRREVRRVAADLARRPGLHVYTTIDRDVQEQGEEALAAQLAAIEEGRYGRFAPEGDPSPLEGAAVAIDPLTGAVRAWIGGRDFALSEFDHVEQARRQVGSLVKPFLVAAALEHGFGMVNLVSADTVAIQTAQGPWIPADHVSETALPLREALVRSSNRAAAQLAATLGYDAVREVVRRFGVSGPVPAVPASAIGAFDASLLEMTSAYATFGNGGVRVEPWMVERIEDGSGEVLYERSDDVEPERVIDERIAYVVLDAMRAVLDRGTGYAVRASGFWGDAAGKTGTTNDSRDAWFIGLTPELVTGIWIGFDQPAEVVRGRGGGDLSAPVWARWMRALRSETGGLGGRVWLPPLGVEPVRYDALTGEVLTGDCGGRPGIDYQQAWVIEGRYQVRGCRDGFFGWLEGIWHVFDRPDPRPLRRDRPERRGGRRHRR